MELSRSGHVDTFCRDNLPPPEQWPDLLFDLPEFDYPERLNCCDRAARRRDRRRTAPTGPACTAPARTPGPTPTCYAAANQVAHVLVEDLGVVPGNRVLLRGPNNPWLVACWFGVLKAGGVVVATMPLLRGRELATIDEIAAVDRGAVRPPVPRRPGRPPRSTAGGAPSAGDAPDDLVRRAAAHAGRRSTPWTTAADDVALLAFTSGTTGRPKATMHFHRDVLAIADTFSAHLLAAHRPTTCSPAPRRSRSPSASAALLVFPLRAGASTLLVEKATPAELAELIGRSA